MLQFYFVIMSIVCLVYYGIIRTYTGKWNSTFAGFWFLSAMFHAVGWLFCKYLFEFGKSIIGIILIIFWMVFIFIESPIIWNMWRKPKGKADYLIVLGAHVNGTRISNSLKRRLDVAIQYLKNQGDVSVVVSGGKGQGEDISEADAMAAYLIKCGVEEKRIIRENQSTTTKENLEYSQKEVEKSGSQIEEKFKEQSILIVTNGFHIYRSLLIARKLGYTNVQGLAATSNKVLLLNYLVREFFAVILSYIRCFCENEVR